MMNKPISLCMATRKHQTGVVLLIALIMLAALSMAGIVLFRQVTTGVIIAGNLAFKTAAVAASDRGVEAARNFLVTTALDLAAKQPGYFPGWCNTTANLDADGNGISDDCIVLEANTAIALTQRTFDPTTWGGWNTITASPAANTLATQVTADDGAGNDIRYVIHRLCKIAGAINISNQQCVTIGASGAGGSQGAVGYGTQALSNTMQPYYRITVRTAGPKNTVAYTQVIMY